jgi:hypothetical protein
MRMIHHITTRLAALLCDSVMTCEDLAALSQPVPLFEAHYRALLQDDGTVPDDPAFSVYRFLRYLALHKPVVFHGSPRSDLDVLLPLSETIHQGQPARFLYASGGVLFPLVHGLNAQPAIAGKQWPFRVVAFYRRMPPDAPRLYAHVSVNEALKALPFDTTATLYVCRREDFEPLARKDRAARWTGAAFTSEGTTWIARQPVRPVARVQLDLLDCPVVVEWRKARYKTRRAVINHLGWRAAAHLLGSGLGLRAKLSRPPTLACRPPRTE